MWNAIPFPWDLMACSFYHLLLLWCAIKVWLLLSVLTISLMYDCETKKKCRWLVPLQNFCRTSHLAVIKRRTFLLSMSAGALIPRTRFSYPLSLSRSLCTCVIYSIRRCFNYNYSAAKKIQRISRSNFRNRIYIYLMENETY